MIAVSAIWKRVAFQTFIAGETARRDSARAIRAIRIQIILKISFIMLPIEFT
jgi:hypothetical protein